LKNYVVEKPQATSEVEPAVVLIKVKLLALGRPAQGIDLVRKGKIQIGAIYELSSRFFGLKPRL
jgi:hypothetical protein